MTDALTKITEINPDTGTSENLIDEDEVIDILIVQKEAQLEQLNNQQQQSSSLYLGGQSSMNGDCQQHHVLNSANSGSNPAHEEIMSGANPSPFTTFKNNNSGGQPFALADFIQVKHSTPNRQQINFILKQIAN